MKILFTLVCTFVMTISPVQANTNGNFANAIKNVFDQHRYNMTVQWDQEDLAVKNSFEKELAQNVQNLIDQGAKKEDLFSFLEQNILDPQSKLSFEMLKKSLSPDGVSVEESFKAIKHFEKSIQKTGANFRSDSTGFLIFRVAITAAMAITLLVVFVLTYEGDVSGGGDGYEDDGYDDYYDDYYYDDYYY